MIGKHRIYFNQYPGGHGGDFLSALYAGANRFFSGNFLINGVNIFNKEYLSTGKPAHNVSGVTFNRYKIDPVAEQNHDPRLLRKLINDRSDQHLFPFVNIQSHYWPEHYSAPWKEYFDRDVTVVTRIIPTTYQSCMYGYYWDQISGIKQYTDAKHYIDHHIWLFQDFRLERLGGVTCHIDFVEMLLEKRYDDIKRCCLTISGTPCDTAFQDQMFDIYEEHRMKHYRKWLNDNPDPQAEDYFYQSLHKIERFLPHNALWMIKHGRS